MASDASARGRRLFDTLVRDALAALWGTVLAAVALWYLYGTIDPLWAVVCGVLGGVASRRAVRPAYAAFPRYLRIFLSVGVVGAGTIVASWATLVREPAAFWLLRWREAVMLPMLAAVLGVGIAAVIYTHGLLEKEIKAKRRLEDDLKVARRIQQSLLRSSVVIPPWLEARAVNHASREVGGDYYEVFNLADDGVCLAVADVAGKGVPAALLMSSLQSAFLAGHAMEPRLDRLCAALNRFLVQRTTPERYATLFVAKLWSDGRMQYVNAGHNPPLVVGDGSVRELWGGGIPVGLLPDRSYELQNTRLHPGEILLVYTDGVTEAGSPRGEEFGTERLIRVVAGHARGSLADVAAAVLEALASHGAGEVEPADDVTFLLLRLRQPSA